MFKLDTFQTRAEDFIEKNRIHLKATHLVNEIVMKTDPVRTVTLIRKSLIDAVGVFVTKKETASKYISEKDLDNGVEINLDLFIFSKEEMKDFVDAIRGSLL